MRFGFIPLALLFILLPGITLPSVFAQSSNAVKAKAVLDACQAKSKEKLKVLTQVSEGIANEKKDAVCENEKPMGALSKDLKQVTQAVQAKASEASDQSALGFAMDFRIQTLKNAVTTYLDAELRYQESAEIKTPGLHKTQTVVSMFCKKLNGIDTCSNRERETLARTVDDYRKSLKEQGVKTHSDEEVRLELNQKLSHLNEAYRPVNLANTEWRDASLNRKDPSSDQTALAARPASLSVQKKVFEKQVKPAQERYDEKYAQFMKEAQAGTGLLFYSKVLRDKIGVELPGELKIKTKVDVRAAIEEIKSETLRLAHETNEELSDYFDHDTFMRRKAKSIQDQVKHQALSFVGGFYDFESSLKRMLKTNPVAAAQVLVLHPEYAGLVCDLSLKIQAGEELNQTIHTAVNVVTWGGMIVGGAMVMTGVLAPAGVTIEASSSALLTLSQVNNVVGIAALAGNIGTQVKDRFQLKEKIQSNQDALVSKTGGNLDELKQSEKEIAEQNKEAMMLAAQVLAPMGAGKLTKLVRASDLFKDSQIFTRFDEMKLKIVSDQNTRVGLEILDYLCGSVGLASCQYLVNAFHAKPKAEQLKILENPNKIDKFYTETLGQKKHSDVFPSTKGKWVEGIRPVEPESVERAIGRKLLPDEVSELKQAAEGESLGVRRQRVSDPDPKLSNLVSNYMEPWLKKQSPEIRNEIERELTTLPVEQKKALIGRMKSWSHRNFTDYFWSAFHHPEGDGKNSYYASRLKVLAKSNASPLDLELEKASLKHYIDHNLATASAYENVIGSNGKYLRVVIGESAQRKDRKLGVKNFSEEESALLKVKVIEGKVCDQNGKPISTRAVDLHDYQSVKRIEQNLPGSGLFVMDEHGEIYILNEEIVASKLHHSSILSGKPVSAAGQIEIQNGVIVKITDQSGHYRPPVFMTYQFIEELRLKGANLGSAEVEVTTER